MSDSVIFSLMSANEPIILQNLPYEVLTLIFRELPLRDILSIILTCKQFRDVVSRNNIIWKRKLFDSFIVNYRKYSKGKYPELTPYHRCRISSNWNKGFYKSYVIAQTQDKYMPWINLHPEYLIHSTGFMLASYPRNGRGLPYSDKLLWRITTPTVPTHDVRTNDISRFVLKENTLVCGNRDGCMAVYNLVSNKRSSIPSLKDHIINCHKDGRVEVSAVECGQCRGQKPYVVSCSMDDDRIKFWTEQLETNYTGRGFSGIRNHNKSFQCIKEIPARINGAMCMNLNDQTSRLAVGLNCNSRPLLIDSETTRIVYNGEEHTNVRECVRDIQWINEHVVAYVRHSGFLTIFDQRTGDIMYNNTDPMASSLYSLGSDGLNTVVTGCAQLSRCVVYDVRRTRGFVQVLFTQKCSSPVYSLGFDANVLTAAAERSVATLNFNINTSKVPQRDYSSIINFFR